MKPWRYESLDHTADIGLRVFTRRLDDLFQGAAMALFEHITDIEILDGTGEHAIEVTGEDRADLLVNWLREVLYLWTGKECLLASAAIRSVSDTRLTAMVRTDPFDPDRHVIHNEIKAVTYHGVSVEKTADGWMAEVIFDV